MMSYEQNKKHEKADVCYICHEPFHGKVKRKVRETMTTQQVRVHWSCLQ